LVRRALLGCSSAADDSILAVQERISRAIELPFVVAARQRAGWPQPRRQRLRRDGAGLDVVRRTNRFYRGRADRLALSGVSWLARRAERAD
jgi:hypothetical protein